MKSCRDRDSFAGFGCICDRFARIINLRSGQQPDRTDAGRQQRTCSERGNLAERKINIDAKDKFGNTALTKEVENGRTDIVVMLLENGANHSIRSNNFENALSIAEKTGQSEIRALLKNHKGKKSLFGIF